MEHRHSHPESSEKAVHQTRDHTRRSFESLKDKKEKLNTAIEEIENIELTDKNPSEYAKTKDSVKKLFNVTPKKHRPERVNNAINDVKDIARHFREHIDDFDYLSPNLRSRFVSAFGSMVGRTENFRDQAVANYGKLRESKSQRAEALANTTLTSIMAEEMKKVWENWRQLHEVSGKLEKALDSAPETHQLLVKHLVKTLTDIAELTCGQLLDSYTQPDQTGKSHYNWNFDQACKWLLRKPDELTQAYEASIKWTNTLLPNMGQQSQKFMEWSTKLMVMRGEHMHDVNSSLIAIQKRYKVEFGGSVEERDESTQRQSPYQRLQKAREYVLKDFNLREEVVAVRDRVPKTDFGKTFLEERFRYEALVSALGIKPLPRRYDEGVRLSDRVEKYQTEIERLSQSALAAWNNLISGPDPEGQYRSQLQDNINEMKRQNEQFD